MTTKTKSNSISKTAILISIWLASLCFLSPGPARAADPTPPDDAAGNSSGNAAGNNTEEDAGALKTPVITGPEIWKDPSQPLDTRVHDLVRRLSLKEKVSLMGCDAPAIPRLGIPAYSHRNECLHGVLNGVATVFPQAIAMAATWDTPLIQQEADVISTEARAKYNDYATKHGGASIWHGGLSFYSPNINLFRDPRWGRGQETYGEDPFLDGQFAVAFIRGLQGNDPNYIKILAGAKHYVVHSGPEPLRHEFNAKPSARDLHETYLPAFEAAVREGHVGSIMGAYNSVYGIPACASPFLLTDVLRKRWGFNGFVVSDGGAIWDIWGGHHFAKTPAEAAADAVKAGCDLCSGGVPKTAAQARRGARRSRGWYRGGTDFNILTQSVKEGLVSVKQIDTAVGRVMRARFRLGMFDPPSRVPWSKITIAQNDTPEHQALALKVARESIVLLKNNGILPLDRAKIKRIAVIGPNADSVPALLGNYHGDPSHPVTILQGIKQQVGDNVEVTCEKGAPLALRDDNSNKPTPDMEEKAIDAAKNADVVIYVGGIDATLEREESHRPPAACRGFHFGDRTRIELPILQEELVKALYVTGKPIVFVNCSGSAMAIPWETENLPAIVQAWYPGEEGGRAVAEVLFGEINPAGRLPVTFYRSTEDLPSFEDYSMANRTYRYFKGKPLYAFGFGLSYTKFDYANPKLATSTLHADDTMKISFTVKNTGPRDGDEVPQIYFRHIHSAVPQPKEALCGFTRIHLAKGAATTVSLDIPAERFRYWDTTQGNFVVEPGKYELLIGPASDNIRLRLPFAVKQQ